jgi:predicted nucleic acid-binding protein
LWKHVKIHKDLKAEDEKSELEDLIAICDRLRVLAARELSEEAMDIALKEEINVYDALYIAAAMGSGGML